MMRLIDSVPPDVVVSVSRLANYLARKLAADPKLRRLGVSGEISGIAYQPSGSVYFDLKDRDALVKCVAWSDAAAGFPPLANGQAVIATGSIGTYGKKSMYQLNVTAVELEGAGRLHAVYEALKRRLDGEGLFAAARKRPLPPFPFRIALISSRSANGAEDFRTQAAARAPHVSIELFETPVQGENAVPEIVRAIERASRASVDIVVIARGGGSYEDLFVFSDERVVRALARCPHPTVSAIGHEADTPLTDFVADHRAATPSAAAQTILPRRSELLQSLTSTSQRLQRAAARGLAVLRRDLSQIEIRSPLAAADRLIGPRRQRLETAAIDLRRAAGTHLRVKRTALGDASGRLAACNPSVQLSRRGERLALASFALNRAARDAVARYRRRAAGLTARIEPAVASGLKRRSAQLRLIEAMLDGRDPTRILQRGYAIITVDGVVLRDAATVAPGTLVHAQVARGTLAARVETTSADGGE